MGPHLSLDAFSGRTGTRGQPLPSSLRTLLEGSLGVNLRGVRVCADPAADALGARAFACGDLVVVSPGVARRGSRVLAGAVAHEVAHVVQSRNGGRPGRPAGRAVLLEDAALEEEACRAARAVLTGRRFSVRGAVAPSAAPAGLPVLQRIKMTLGTLEYPHILQAMEDAVKGVLDKAAPPAMDKGDHYVMASGANWIWMCGKLVSHPPSALGVASILPAKLRIQQAGLHVKAAGHSERIDFVSSNLDKKDLNYKQVQQEVNNLGIKDDDLAQNMLRRVQGITHVRVNDARKQNIIDSLIGLLFGVESSRFPGGLICTIMFLDLIYNRKKYGSGQKPFNFKNAFDSDQWEDGQLYGGKYPYATHGTGSGNGAGSLGMHTALTGDTDLAYKEHYTGLPQRHAVPRREVSLCIHWLQAKFGAQAAEKSQEEVKLALQGRLEQALTTTSVPPALPGDPSLFTGVHSSGAAKSARPRRNFPQKAQKVWIHKGAGVYFHYYEDCGRSTGRDGVAGANTAMLAGERRQDTSLGTVKGAVDRALEENQETYLVRRLASGSAEAQAYIDGEWAKVPCTEAIDTFKRKPCPKCFKV